MVVNIRVNDMVFFVIFVFVGYCFVVIINVKKIEVFGELMIGLIFQIVDVFIEDKDGDFLLLDKMNNVDDIKWYLVDNEVVDFFGILVVIGMVFIIFVDVGGKKIKIVY